MPGSRYVRITAAAVVMAAVVFLAGTMVRRPAAQVAAVRAPMVDQDALAAEAGMFRFPELAQVDEKAPKKSESKRDLRTFYARRAYPGAPPIIPHELLDTRTMGGNNCLGCHRNGGYVPDFKAYAPVTPHPEQTNCFGCHVPETQRTVFRATEWEKPQGPELKQEALPLGPPPIPHGLQMRENCLACHAGPGAVAEIRTPHPERVNCRQCHAESGGGESAFRRNPQ
jgi:nitrate reductase (cytochrome), electron transfer subunit